MIFVDCVIGSITVKKPDDFYNKFLKESEEVMSDLPQLDGPRVEPENGKPEKLVILCHGYGSNGEDLIGLVPHLKRVLPNAVFVSPNAPEQVPGYPMGYQWFPLSTLSREERLVGTLKAAPTLHNFIDQELKKYGLEEKDLILVGFSQGTMMSLHVGLRRLSDIGGIVGFSLNIAFLAFCLRGLRLLMDYGCA